MTDDLERKPLIRGLATIALLKVNFDASKDFLSMFEPFVVDGVCSIEEEDVDPEKVRTIVSYRHGLLLPISTIQTLLSRSVRSGYLENRNGRLMRTGKVPEKADLASLRESAEIRQTKLAERLATAFRESVLPEPSVPDALGLIIEFLERFHVRLVVDGTDSVTAVMPASPVEGDGVSFSERMVARVLFEILSEGGSDADVLEEMLAGYVLQNALLLTDIASGARSFRGLRVFLDSNMVMKLLGLLGPIEETATKDLVLLLQATGASVEVFNETEAEVKRVLDVYVTGLRTSAGTKNLWPRPLTRYIVTHNYSSSDIQIQIGLLRNKLRALDIQLRSLPLRRPETTLDEKLLAEMLSRDPDEVDTPRVRHDVDCAAAVLTIRGNASSRSFDEVHCVMISDSSQTCRTIDKWFEGQGGSGLAPMVNYLFLSTMAWLKQPSSATKLKVHELVALCSAALRPTASEWEKFARELKKLEDSGQITSDEVVVIWASALTDDAIVSIDPNEGITLETVDEVVKRVTNNLVSEHVVKEEELKSQIARNQANEASIKLVYMRRARRFSRSVTMTGATLLMACGVVGAVLSINHGTTWSAAKVILVCVFVALSVASILGEFNVRGFRSRAEVSFRNALYSFQVKHFLMASVPEEPS